MIFRDTIQNKTERLRLFQTHQNTVTERFPPAAIFQCNYLCATSLDLGEIPFPLRGQVFLGPMHGLQVLNDGLLEVLCPANVKKFDLFLYQP